SAPGKPASLSVGTSCSAALRLLLITASARSLPSFTSGEPVGNALKLTGTWPASVKPLRDETRHYVGRAAWHKRHDDAHRTRRVSLRRRAARRESGRCRKG